MRSTRNWTRWEHCTSAAAALLIGVALLTLAGCGTPAKVSHDGGRDLIEDMPGAGGGGGNGGNGGEIADAADAPDSPAGTTPNGEACDTSGQCSSGFCVHENGSAGFCCDQACTGTCYTCTAQGNVGTCLQARADTDPKNECEDLGLSSCKTNGFCDGNGACALYGSGTVCKSPRCVGSTRTLASVCDGKGACAGQGTLDCAPFKCGTNDACLNSCTGVNDCTAGNLCLSNVCGKLPPGATCSQAADCNSGFCEQNVCCDRSCRGTCQSCALQGSEGACTNVLAGADPLNQCQDMQATSCSYDGACDGNGACRKYQTGTVCKPAVCNSSTRTPAGQCNDTGTCVTAAAGSCDPFMCGANGECLNSCNGNGDCNPPNLCLGGICRKKPTGQDCSGPSECETGFCEQGKCCATSCSGICRACNLTGTVGTCTYVAQDQDPFNQCADQGASSCKLDGTCDGNGACHSYAAGTTCRPAACLGAAGLTPAASCDGNGNCITPSSQTCEPFQCGLGACLMVCTGDNECAPGYVCNGGRCGLKPIGAICAAAVECASGFCAQGYCCNSACAGTCMSCGLASSPGTCSKVAAGNDPLDQCIDETGTSPCGLDGTCDGNGACRYRVVSTVCSPASCAGGTYTPPRTCNGSGVCQTVTPQSCGSYQCDSAGTACKSSCTGSSDCVSPYTCVGNQCGKKPNGQDCGAAAECASGFCAQSKCCETNCTGLCLSCAVTGAFGTCTYAPANTDPLSQCTDETGTNPCGHDGMCDGAGACRWKDKSTSCAGATCTGSTRTPQRMCNGAGACDPPTTVACDPFLCGASGDCLASCTGNSDCVSPNTCLAGSCGKKKLGDPCGSAGECNSGFCAQGVCCNTTCSGTCQACNLPNKGGTCTFVPPGDDPLNQCSDQGVLGCKLDGTCDGNGGCRLYPTGSVCVAATCNGSTHTPARTCNGTGTCQSTSPDLCDPYRCGSNGSCLQSCSADGDCVAPYTCNAAQCTLKVNGTACTNGSECFSNTCSQGVCCNQSCAGTCRACNVGGSLGTCINVPSGQDPNNQCTAQAASTCGNDGLCDGNGACRKYQSNTTCVASSCSGSTFTPARTCDGAGTCESTSGLNCAPYGCDDTAGCKTTCSTAADCATGLVCTSGRCGKAPGSSCSVAADCASNICAQGVCCATACSGLCRSCSVAGSLGSCTNVPDGDDPLSQCDDQGASTCGTDGMCNGAGACRKYRNGSVCQQPSCTGSTLSNARTCDGSGNCQTASTAACDPYTCGTGACKATCTTNGDCISGYSCSGGVCRRINGSACIGSLDCSSGNCVQNVCCDSPCSGTCTSCTVTGKVGTCSPVPAGQDPFAQCSAATCTTPSYTPPATCNGNGACTTPSATNCTPFACTTAGCKATCVMTADCAPNYTCATGLCKKVNGQACTAASECASAQCAQGICCATACNGTCKACNVAGSLGTCSNIPNGQDPLSQCTAGACVGTVYTPTATCNGLGACTTPGSSDCAPLACTTTGCKSTCSSSADCAPNYSCVGNICKKNDGQTCAGDSDCASAHCAQGVCCAGACTAVCKACNLPGTVGTCTSIPNGQDPLNQCTDASCTTPNFTPDSTCNGAGACTSPSTTSCTPYSCSAAGCRSSCTVDTDCASGYRCASGSCKKINGQPCSTGGECASAQCAQGYCCATTCSGTCRSCAVAGSLGTCTNVPNGQDPLSQCTDASCSSSSYTPAATCNGSGACTSPSTTNCTPYSCSATGCRMSCSTAADCATGYTCAAGTCKKDIAQACTASTDCASGNCAQGVCCTTACGGACKSCNVSGSAGTCTNIPNGQDPLSQCSAAACSVASFTPAAVCNGSGSCTTVSSANCSPYACTTAGCRASCTSNGDCAPSYACSAGSCKKDVGQACTVNADCAAGNCAQGVCCATPCTGTCRSCNVSGSAGTCTNIPNGQDPLSQCADATCTAAVFTPDSVCNGSGTCTTPSASACAPYNCTAAGGCKASCTTSADCATGYACAGGVCKKDVTQSCALGSECASGFCSQGVCCGTSCSATCKSCNIGGSVGTCTNIANGQDPLNQCADAACTSGSFTPDSVCNGSGACTTPATTACSPFACTTAGCKASCTTSADCATGYACAGSVCKKDVGQSCATATECASNACSQGVCCNTACNGTCKACNLAGSVGTCSNVPAGQDPLIQCTAASCSSPSFTPAATCNGSGACGSSTAQNCSPYTCTLAGCKASCTSGTDCIAGYTCASNSCKKINGQTCSAGTECASGNCVDGVCCNNSCPGTCTSCALSGSLGTCTPAPAGQDPRDQCADNGANSCGTDGQCNGAGACRMYSNGTSCGSATCASGTFTPAGSCNGSGTCTPGTGQACSPFNCTTAGCKSTCVVNADCASGFTCAGSSCKRSNGQSCSVAGDCASGNCAQGVCCATACTATCYSCNLTGTQGTCSLIPAGQDPLNQCSDASCSNASFTPDSTCNGGGACTTPSALACAPYNCTTAGCRSSCTASGDCATGYVCASNVCKRDIGQTCSVAADCASGNCAQGVCCTTACSGTCRSCALSGSIGTCSFAASGTDPLLQCNDNGATTCGTDGQCDGAGACRMYASGTTCGTALCSSSIYTPAGTCNGSGTCNAGTAQSCPPYDCTTSGCRTSCSTSAQCSSGFACASNVCKKDIGGSCGVNGDCASGFCAQGVCCATACGTACKSCNLAGSVGTCTNIPNGQDPLSQCAAASCAGSVYTPTATCNGLGACGTPATTNCSPLACTTSGCKSTCSAPGDCAGGYTCVSNVCKKVNGQTCAVAGDCASGFCAQGYCCNTACNTSCAACNLAGSQGTCGNIASGQDPLNQCADATCTNAVFTPSSLCTGSGACTTVSSTTCSPYNCTTGGCKATCSTTADCAPGFACAGNVCKKDVAQPCAVAGDCASGFCSQGVCCSTSCTGTCKSCNVSGSAGTCSNVPSGFDPLNQCADASCSNATFTPDSLCNGSGACTTVSPTACAPYSCTTAGCKATCSTTADCASGYACAGNICKKDVAQPCAVGTDCASGNCAQGVCCTTACTATCKSCNLSGTVGTCTNIANGQDPLNQCTDATCASATFTPDSFCNGGGSCTSVSAISCSPYGCTTSGCKATCSTTADCASGYACAGNVCKKDVAQPCSVNGDCASAFCAQGVCCATACGTACKACNLAGNVGTCTNVPSGQDPLAQCAASSCSSPSFTPTATCNGTGACSTPATQNCSPYVCTTTGCKASCSSNSDCITGYSCAGNVCKKNNGQTCSVPGDCATGNCVDGYCCNSTCGGLCQACDVAGSQGTCTNVPNGTDPTNECAAASCTSPNFTAKANCNGSAACTTPSVQNCSPYVCTTAGCKTSCSVAGDCVTNYSCVSNVCKRNNGQTCGVNGECASGNCVDGYCCNSTCNSLCQACNVAGSLGTCTSIPNGTDPTNECAAASCTSPNFTAKANCNGAAACTTPSAQNCSPYICTVSGCKTSCTASSDCVTGYACAGNVCKKDVGQSCSVAGDCATGFCAQGVCCNSGCTATCYACNLSGTAGTCTAVGSGLDPLNQCAAASCVSPNFTPKASCSGSGTCGTPSAQNCSPYVCTTSGCKTSCTGTSDCVTGYVCSSNVCKKDVAQTCAAGTECASGFCSQGVCCSTSCTATCKSCKVTGSIGTCTNIPSGTDPLNQCSDATCVNATFTPDSLCNGGGACTTVGSATCSPYNCTTAGCKASCSASADCASGYACSGTVCKKDIGQTCSVNGDCATGICAQGYCCGTTCTATCKSCGVAGSLGTCTNIPNGSDPLNQCADATCASASFTPNSLCNGNGACTTVSSTNCSPYSCTTSGCKSSCTGAGDCATGYACASNVCKKDLGQSCSAGTDCASTFCADGVCCNNACTGLCRSCNASGSIGTCTNFAAGSDPGNECTDAGAATCGTDGMCDGAGACRLYASTTQCAGVTCSDGTHSMAARNCNGTGTCTAGTAVACTTGYACVSGVCKTSCTVAGDCASTHVCVSNSCLPGNLGNGTACTGNAQCTSGNCVDGYCCNNTCAGACRSCAVTGSLGVCTNHTAGSDPDSDCTDNGASGCGTDGMCDGAGACRLYSSATQCAGVTCSDGTHSMAARNCNGAGTCIAGTAVACNNGYACVAGACKTSCTATGDCASGYICSGNVCIGSGLANGSVCSTGAQCTSGNCVDGYCCNGTCTGACRSCAVTGSLGICTNHAAGSDPDNDCTDNGAPGCGTDGMCDGAGACRLYASTTQCAAASCPDATHQMAARNCNGTGTCTAGTSVACSTGYACVVGACKTSCTVATDCASTHVCVSNSCLLGNLGNGTACTGNAQCTSGNCVDGYCCNSTCTGACRACNVAGSFGTCTNYAAGSDPGNECSDNGASGCGTDGMCDGAGACRLYASTTQCAAASCPDATHQMAARNCNGTGTCTAGTSVACTTGYACVAGACKTSCTVAGDCASGYTCSGNVCISGGLAGNGTACTAGTECTSGNCVDGYCCDSACTGACRACNVAGALGVCTNHAAASDPDNECSDNGAPACGTDGMCDGAGACRLYTSTTQCAAASCPDATHQMAARNCNGTGTCTAGTSVACTTGYACVAGACKTSCTVAGDCASGYTCNGTTCVSASTIKLQYRCADTAAPNDNWIRPHLRIYNTGSTALNLSTVKFRYWFTKEANTGSALQGQCDYSTVACPNNAGAPAEFTVAKTGADRYAELTFATGTVNAGQFDEIQWGFHKADWSTFTETGDYSYDSTYAAFADFTKITVYQTADGGATWTLVWGTEPS